MKPWVALDAGLCWEFTLTLWYVSWLALAAAVPAVTIQWLLGARSARYRYTVGMTTLFFIGLSLPATLVVVHRTKGREASSAATSTTVLTRPIELAGAVPRPEVSRDGEETETSTGTEAKPGQTASIAAPSTPRKVLSPALSSGKRSEREPLVRTAAPFITGSYAVGVLVMLVKLLAAIQGGSRLRRACRPVADSSILELAARQARRLGLRFVPPLNYCERVAVPVVFGIARPMILLPITLATGLSSDELAAVLMHELAHVRRYDHWLILVQRVIEALFFFHPAVWYLSRRVHQDREHCCDDLVVAAGEDRLNYAAALLRVAELRMIPRAGLNTMATLAVDGRRSSLLRRRVIRLIEEPHEPAVRLRRPGLVAAAAVVLSLAGLGVNVRLTLAVPQPPGRNVPGPAGVVTDNGDVRWRGQVVELETGKPLANVAVAAEVRRAQQSGTSPDVLAVLADRSDAQGQFTLVLPGRLRGLGMVELHVLGNAEGRSAHRMEFDYEFEPGKSETPRTILQLPAGAVVSGRVLDPDGEPAAGIMVGAGTLVNGRDGGPLFLTSRSQTDRRGRFQIVVPEQGNARLNIMPPHAIRFERELGTKRGDLGDLRLLPGTPVVGRVVDVAGQPVAHVAVGLDDYSVGFFLPQAKRQTITDAEGRFALPPMPPGTYEVAPIADLAITAGETRPEQLPEPYRHLASTAMDLLVEKPLPGAFPKQRVTLKEGADAVEVELKAVPHARLTARTIDGDSRPAPAWAQYPIRGRLGGEAWWSAFHRVPGEPSNLTAIVPIGLEEIHVENFGDNIFWTWAPGKEPLTNTGIRLKRVDGDLSKILIQRYRSATLEIRLHAKSGALPKSPHVGVYYPRYGGADGGPVPTRVGPGVYRLDNNLLPHRLTEVDVRAAGFKTMGTVPFIFPKEGVSAVVDLTLEPGVSEDGLRETDRVPIDLRTPEGEPIAHEPAKPDEPVMEIACQAIDGDTGRPVAGARVEFGIEQQQNEDGETEYRDLLSEVTGTDSDGRFTVRVPKKYLPDPEPKREVLARVTIRHPSYVDYWHTTSTRDIASRGLAPGFPAFRAVRLLPARVIVGRLVDRERKPIAGASIYKAYDLANWPADAEYPVTNKDGRFRAKVPVASALKLEFRTTKAARNYVNVEARQTDLGEIRITAGSRITGRVLDAAGAPVPWISVTAPASPDSNAQPNFVYTTDAQGRFQSDELGPGSYAVTVGGIHRTEKGENSPLAVKDAPGVYVPRLVEIRDGQPGPKLTLQPVVDVVLTATLTTSRVMPEAKKSPALNQTEEEKAAESQKAFANLFQFIPFFTVRGQYEGVTWGSTFSFNTAKPNHYSVRVPRGLTGAKLEFGGFVQRFQVGKNAPELFGTGFQLDRVDTDQPSITLRRYRETTLRIAALPDGATRPRSWKAEAHYVREPEMRAKGALFDQPLLTPREEKGALVFSALPDEEITLSTGVPGTERSQTRVKLTEGETREISVR
jgi:beta-lactamase regulating signal transducer with metallopeptidase domain